MRRRLSFFARVAAREEGMAMVTVVMVIFIASLLGALMAANMTSELNQVRRQRNVTSARTAADGGVDRLVFALQQGTNWQDFVTQYKTSSGNWWGDPANGGWWKIGDGRFRAHVDCYGMNCSAGDPSRRLVTVEGQYPAGTGEVRTIQATLRRQAPEGLSYALFADIGIDIHHHGSSWISPTVVTTAVHSNGYINLDHSSSFRVDLMSAVTTVSLGKGGGSTPGGSIPSTGYNWGYWISGSDAENSPRCFPPKVFPAQTQSNTDPSFSTYWATPAGDGTCPGAPKYSPNAQVIGDVYANQVQVNGKGNTVAGVSGTTCAATGQPGFNDPTTGACIPDRKGDVHAHVVTGLGPAYQGPSSGNQTVVHYRSGISPPPCEGANCVADCPSCNQGTADVGGRIGGSVYAHAAGWRPERIEFPSLDYEATWKPKAVAEQGGASTCSSSTKTCHVFPTSDGKDFFQYVSNSAAVTGGYAASSCQTCLFWLDKDKKDTTDKKKVQYVVYRGTLYSNRGLSFDSDDMRKLFGTETGLRSPTVMIQGAVISPADGVDLGGNLTIVGPTMDPFQPRAPYPSSTVPGILAAGGSIGASDADSDSKWDSAGQYEGLKTNRTIIRGLVYGGEWKASTGRSVAQSMHMHSYDPKNQMTIIGSQVGAKLHDCNSFEFAYDPLVRNLPGFISGDAGGGVYVVEWNEI